MAHFGSLGHYLSYFQSMKSMLKGIFLVSVGSFETGLWYFDSLYKEIQSGKIVTFGTDLKKNK